MKIKSDKNMWPNGNVIGTTFPELVQERRNQVIIAEKEQAEMAKTPLAQSQYSSWAGPCKRSLSTENSSQQQNLMGWIAKYRPGNQTKEQLNAFLPH